MNRHIALFLAIFFLVLSNPLLADNWPQFRGQYSNNLTSEKTLPIEWDEEKNILWKIDFPGRGWSSPIVWENRVFISTAVLHESSTPAKSASQA